MATTNNNDREHKVEQAIWQFLDAQLRGSARDIEELVKKYPEFEDRIRQKIAEFQKVDSLFDSLVQADESDFEDITDQYDLVGKNVGSFKIEEIIGRGGMGVVYLARDTKLDRHVAIKSLPSELLSSSTARSRFRREAKLLASLNHPNIAVIHDIIESDAGLAYLVLEYIPGETLAEHIASKSLELKQALSIGLQVAEAVSAAHEKGVIHRDLKPGNINITSDGRVKVLDFGLAKASTSEGKSSETTATQPGRVMGTPAYMSPEQARGKPVDHHTDIWSFGCIMYQMLTSQLPFDGETATDILVRILEREPDWELIPSETPENIRVLLHRCLEKDPHRRLKLIRDATIEIKETLNLMADGSATLVQSPRPKQLTDREGSCRIKSLAVLPLENLTGDPQQEYFADGMTEALIADLGKIGALQVRSRTSIMQYKSVKKLLPAIARELNVDAIVEGSVMRVAERVRITAQLIHAPTDTHIWVDSYERDLCDILNLLSEVARTIAHQIEIKVTPGQEVLLSAKRPINPEAYEAYQRGMFLLNKFTPEGIKKGLDYLNQAIEKDPGDPLAYGKLALGYAAIAHGPGAPPNALEQTEKAALKALELDKTLVEAHAALAHIKLYRDWDWEAAEKALQRALKLNPSLTLTHSHYSWYLLLFGRMDEAFMEMRRVQELDPLMPLWPAYLGTQYLWAGRYEESINEIQKSLELDSNLAYGLDALGSAYAAKGMFEEAIKAHLRACELGREWKSGLALTYAMAGRNDEARLVLDELEVDATTYDTWFIAQVYAVLGQNDEAFHWLEKACGPPKQPYVPWTKQCPAYRSLHDDPRYEDLLRRMNLLQ